MKSLLVSNKKSLIYDKKISTQTEVLVIIMSFPSSYFQVNFDKRNSKMDLVNKFKNKLKDFTSKYDQIMKDAASLNLTRQNPVTPHISHI